ncbi:proton-conducting transporter transmembrane domain-containing protein [Botrimarina hoheduenensis]|uniref:NADH-quinone oxidoreductase subunit M n=1 Tax=Botrimarina hoheduenensis TaxID=2528000 RepID=A0A5C5VQ57_9BACT|nr:proton-conducting transporter membrane subunit [Botrimarina hoheduenensis]TWT40756.1 NADH-quinone oxidoreductase subunit M [Botrimarina hoheduenensis]
MIELHFPLLELAILAPLVGAILAHGAAPDRARRIALTASALSLTCGLVAWFDLASIRSFEAHDRWTLLSWLPGGDPLVIDELSAPLIPLASLQFLLVILATLRTKASRFSLTGALISEAVVIATLATREPWVLATLLTLGTIPPTLELIRRGQTPRVFVAHMGLFVLLLFSGLAIRQLAAAGSLPHGIGEAFVTLAVLIRCGGFPLHGWIPDLFQRASFGSSILFMTPLLGAYAALRLVLPDSPDWALRTIATVSMLTALYSAGLALVERDARRFYAHLLLSQASLVLLGMELATLLGMTGALCVWLSVGLAMSGFGLTLRCVESRVGRLALDRFNGLHDAVPTLAGLFLLTGLASIGFPGTIGFIALEILIEGAVHSAPAIGVMLLIATALNGIAVMRAYFRVFTGKVHSGTINLKASPPERVAVLILSLLILGGGIFPQPGVASREHAARALLEHRQSGAKAALPDRETTSTATINRTIFTPR